MRRFLAIPLLLLTTVLLAYQFPRPSGYVNDFAGVISPEYEAKIESFCRELEQKTGAELAIVTINDIDDYTYQEYANELFTRWQIGKRGKDNGILVLDVPSQRKLWIEVGYGLEGILPDGLVGEVRDRYYRPYLKDNDYDHAHYYGALAIARIIAKDAGVTLSGGQDVSLPTGTGGKRSICSTIFGIIFLVFLIMFCIRHPELGCLMLMLGSRGFGGGMMTGGGFGGGGFGGFGGGMSGGGGAGGGY